MVPSDGMVPSVKWLSLPDCFHLKVESQMRVSGMQLILSRDIDNELQAHEAGDTWVFQ